MFARNNIDKTYYYRSLNNKNGSSWKQLSSSENIKIISGKNKCFTVGFSKEGGHKVYCMSDGNNDGKRDTIYTASITNIFDSKNHLINWKEVTFTNPKDIQQISFDNNLLVGLGVNNKLYFCYTDHTNNYTWLEDKNISPENICLRDYYLYYTNTAGVIIKYSLSPEIRNNISVDNCLTLYNPIDKSDFTIKGCTQFPGMTISDVAECYKRKPNNDYDINTDTMTIVKQINTWINQSSTNPNLESCIVNPY